MKQLVCLLGLLLLPGLAEAADHYIRDGGTASTTGTGACNSGGSGNWNTANACDTLPATLVRILAYVGGIAVLSIVAAQVFQSPPVMSATRVFMVDVRGESGGYVCDRKRLPRC